MVQVSVSYSVLGGFVEGNAAYQQRWGMEINSHPLPKSGGLLVSDASSPVANFRVEEAFMSLVALTHIHSKVNIITDLGCGGTHDEYGHHWDLSPDDNPFWTKFYDETRLMDRIDLKFSPISSGIYKATRSRNLAIYSMWLRLVPYLGKGNLIRVLRHKVNVFEAEFANMKVSKLGSAIPEGGVILTFPCPVCTHQVQTTVYHAIRKRGDSIYVAKSDRSPAHSGCKGGFPWIERWNELSIWEATYHLGARPSGKSIFFMSSHAEHKPGLIIRDYSEPRGTIAATVRNWSKDLWISPRVYVKRNGNDTIANFKQSLAANPKVWAKVICEFPLLGNGRQHDVEY